LRSNSLGSPRKRRAPSHRQRRLARAREGEMLLLDASLHRWLEDRGPELTPLSFYGDRHGIFVRNDEYWSVEEQLAGKRQPTQFGRALAQLGVTYIAARSPQAKGRIERLWGTFQDRLTSELRLARAADLPAANEVLRRFLPDYNRRFGHAPRETEKAWRPAPADLDRICCFLHERAVSNDNVVQWDGRRFQIPPQPKRFSFAGTKVQLYESLEGKVAIYHGPTKLHHCGGLLLRG